MSIAPFLSHLNIYLKLSCWCLLLLGAASAFAQQVVLAFDNTLAPSTGLDGMARTQMLISGLRRAEVKQAIFFVGADRVNEKTQMRLTQYNNAGHLLASHGYNDSLLKRANLYAYKIDLLKANAVLSQFPNYYGYFLTHYYQGNGDVQTRQKLQEFALENHYIPAYATTKSFDGYLNLRYMEQVNNSRRVDMAALEKVYVDMIWQGLERYQQYVIPTHGSAIQVLMLQENDLAAYFIEPLVERIRAEGWEIVSPKLAFGYPKIISAPVNLHTSEGYIKALTHTPMPLREVAMQSHKSKTEIDSMLRTSQIFQ